MDKPHLYIMNSADDNSKYVASVELFKNNDGTVSTYYNPLYQGNEQQCIDWRRTFLHQKKHNWLVRRVN